MMSLAGLSTCCFDDHSTAACLEEEVQGVDEGGDELLLEVITSDVVEEEL